MPSILALPSISFDPAETLVRLGDDRELLAQMVESFRAEYPGMLSAIRTSVASSDAAALARSAHALRGSVVNFGPNESVDSARELERMGLEGVFVGAIERFTMLEEQVARLERDLATFVATSSLSF